MQEEDHSIWRTLALAWLMAITFAILVTFILVKITHSATFKISEYQATKKQCGNTKGITASGHKVRPGFVAADRRHYPFGTVIQLHTGEHLIVADIGRAVRGSRHLDRWRPLGYRCRTTMSRGCVVRRGSGNPYRSVAMAIEYCRQTETLKLQKKEQEDKIDKEMHQQENELYFWFLNPYNSPFRLQANKFSLFQFAEVIS